MRPTLTLSGGLRFETQNAIHDHADWAPRLGFAWGIGGGGKSAPKTVLRGGFGLFYDRFTQDLVLNADRLNGVTQQQYARVMSTITAVLAIDFFPTVPAVSTLPPQTTSSIYQIAPESARALHHAERVQPRAADHKDRQRYLSYLNSRGVHQLMSLIPNAPTSGYPHGVGQPPQPTSFNTPPMEFSARIN